MSGIALGHGSAFGRRAAAVPEAGRAKPVSREKDWTRWALAAVLAGAVGFIASDLYALARDGGWWTQPETTRMQVSVPVVVSADDGAEAPDATRETIGQPDGGPISFTLAGGGVLLARGTIDQGASARFAEEIAALGHRITTISLDSPGGSLDDAMAMATLIRRNGLRTEVADGALCASSCPLVLAGGVARAVGRTAAIGVHQFYPGRGTRLAPDQAMADAQATAARIARHLAGMGVDPALWLHALDTPPETLYYLSAAELSRYRLVTGPLRVARTG
ncbi:MAG: hypothetical protein ABTQ31_03755 [Rhizobiaceae bacterium]